MTSSVSNENVPWEGDVPSHRKEQFAEVFVFLFLIVPSLILSFFVVKQGGMNFVLIALSSILRDLALLTHPIAEARGF